VPTDQVRSRNVAVVMVTAVLPTFAQPGDKLDVNVTSLGDARSLAGGVLVRTHLEGPDGEIYALAQGPLSVGGYKFDLNQNLVQKNHPTVANIPDGATVERSVETELVTEPGYVQLVLNNPDLTTASRVANSIDEAFGRGRARAMDAARVRVAVAEAERINIVHFLRRLENIYVVPDRRARIVVNERTGTVVSGGDVRISPVTISHGDLKLKITTEFQVSQPGYGGFPAFIVGDDINIHGNSGVRTVVVPKTDVDVQEEQPLNVILPQGATVAELVTALSKVRATPRDIITILQGVKRAGALHAELVIQ
jgi:flagellar P-ring protein precursor FlgI